MKRIFSTSPIEHHHLRQFAIQRRKCLIQQYPGRVFLIEPSKYGWTIYRGEGV